MNVGAEVVWIHKFMGELRFPHMELTIMYCDNQSAIQVVGS
jgi:hypothetical protein